MVSVQQEIGPFYPFILIWLITKVWETGHITEGEINSKCYLRPDCEKSLFSAKIKNALEIHAPPEPRAARELGPLSYVSPKLETSRIVTVVARAGLA